MPLAAMPSNKTAKVIDMLKNYFSIVPAKNALETLLLNPNPVIHPIPTILNISAIEKDPEAITSYKDVMTPVALKCMDAVDEERRRICRALDFDSRSLVDIYYETFTIGPVYRPDKKTYTGKDAEAETQSKLYHQEARFLDEDVPYGLVPWAHLGDAWKVSIPTIHAAIQLASIIKDVDFLAIGQNLENLGITGLDRRQLDRYLTEGSL
jgi:opine dehydrogenase